MSESSRHLFTSISLVALLPLLAACDNKRPKPAMKWKPPVEKKGPPDLVFSEARSMIFEGDFENAAVNFRALNARTDVPDSIKDWVLLYGGLAELLMGREPESRPLFTELAERTTPERANGKLAQFLHLLGEKMSGEHPVPSKVASSFDRANHEAIALYLLALKNENLGAIDEALTFYRQFATAQVVGPDLWIGFNTQLKKLRQIALDICEYEEAVDTATRERSAKAQNEEAIERAVENAKLVRGRIKQGGKLLAQLDEALGGKAVVMAAADDADESVFPAAKKRWDEAMAKWEFADAQRGIFEAKLKTEKRRKQQDVLNRKADYLEKFKFYLVLEIGSEGYPKPVKIKTGATIPEGIARLDDTRIYLRDKGNETPVLWSDVAPESIYEMAKSLVSADEEAGKAALRKWHLGNFAAFIGKADEGRKWMQEAAAVNTDYAAEIPLLLGEEPAAER
jgi:hypothetical protein